MDPLIITVIICLIALVIMAYGISRYGWNNRNYITIILVTIAMVLGVIGHIL